MAGRRYWPWTAALTIPHDQVRVSFAVPWEDMLLLGTTDTLHEGEPGAVVATEAEVALPLGTHTLQLLLGDNEHVPHDPPVMSRPIKARSTVSRGNCVRMD